MEKLLEVFFILRTEIFFWTVQINCLNDCISLSYLEEKWKYFLFHSMHLNPMDWNLKKWSAKA